MQLPRFKITERFCALHPTRWATGADFDKRRKELLSQAQAAGDSADSLAIINTTDLRAFICNVLDQLNEEGQRKAAERVAELAEVPKYRKDAAKG